MNLIEHAVRAALTDRTRAARAAAVLAVIGIAGVMPALAANPVFNTGDLVISSSYYQGTASTITVGQALPFSTTGYGTGNSTSTLNASYNGSYSQVFNNDKTDANFGITSQIVLTDISTAGVVGNSLTLAAPSVLNGNDGLTTSFPSKSELALNLSSDGTVLTFMGYTAPVNAIDVSNSNTPGMIDPSNTDIAAPTYRAVGQVDAFGNLTVTPTNAYSGNNGRAAVLSNGYYYMVGNAGNSGKPAPSGTVLSQLSDNTGVQMIAAGSSNPNTTVVGAVQGTYGSSTGYQRGYSITLNGNAADKTGKDDNFRGLTIGPDNSLYVSKGSGGNGVNTVYRVGPGGSLPNTASAGTTGIAIAPGMSTTLASSTTSTVYHPFGIWFANDTTMYVADEGGQALTDATNGTTAGTNTGGLQKWSLVNGTWTLDYVLKTGLNIGQSYDVTGSIGGDSGTVSQFTDGLRNLTGKVLGDGSVMLYAITSTYSNAGDAGADPNRLVAISDSLSATSAGAVSGESFVTLDAATYGQVLRGVSFAPTVVQAVPLPAAAWLMLSGLGGLAGVARRRKASAA